MVGVLARRLDFTAINAIAQRRTGIHNTQDSFLVNSEQFSVTRPRFIPEAGVMRRKIDTEAVRLCVARKSGVILAAGYRGYQ